MTADPQLRERLERAATYVKVDTERNLEHIRAHGARRQRGRRYQALAVAAAIGVLAIFVAWRLQFSDEPTPIPAAGPIGRIAYGSSGPDGLFTLDTTTDRTAPFLDPDGAIIAADWSPDGSQVAYVQERDDGARFAVVVADADGGDPVTIVDEPYTGAAGPDLLDVSWSPDSTRIAYAGRTLWPDGAWNRTVLITTADGSGTPVVLDGHWEYVSWAPDGERLLLSGFPGTTREGQFDLYTARTDGSDLVQLTDDERLERGPAWSPDGTQVVFFATTGSSTPVEYDQDVYVMNADGSNAQRLTDWEGLDVFPVWSPGGAWIAFASDRDASPARQRRNRGGQEQFGGLSMYVMRPDGSDVRRLLTAADDELLLPASWTP